MVSQTASPEQLDPRVREFYLHAMSLLETAEIEYLVGGAYSLAHHAGIVRHTKDLDLFVRRQDFNEIVELFRGEGYPTKLIFPHWLGKVFFEDAYVDLIFGSGNGLCPVDDQWFAHSVDGEALGRAAKLCPAEEIIWTKSFVQERERYDGADIAHVILARGHELDWDRLRQRFNGHETVLLSQLLMFRYIYPGARDQVPAEIVAELSEAVLHPDSADPKLCRGTLLSRQQYLPDIFERGYIDARREPLGSMSAEEISHWTAAIETIR